MFGDGGIGSEEGGGALESFEDPPTFEVRLS